MKPMHFRGIQWLFIGSVLLLPAWLSAQTPRLFINELMAGEQTVIHDIRGEYDDWVEIYNAEDTAVCIAGYYLTDNFKKPKKTQISTQLLQFTTIPPKGHLLLWLDKGTYGRPPIHVDLKLSASGEEVALYSPAGVLIDSISFGPQKANRSYARLGDGNPLWGIPTQPTPKTANGTQAIVFADSPQFSLAGGFYREAISLTLSGAKKGEKIRYTLDGTTPALENGLIYTEPLSIEQTTVVRAAIFAANKVTEDPITQTYFIDESVSLPVISLATDSLALMLETESRGRLGKTYNPVHVAFFEHRKQADWEWGAGFRLQGLAIRFYPQKSMALKGQPKALNYPLFPQKPEITSYEAFSLRNSGNDNSRTLFRDGLMHTLVSEGTHIDYLAYRPVVVFVNGQYWGIHNLREKINRAYLAANHPEAGKNLDFLEWKNAPIQGNDAHFEMVVDFASTQDLSISANYDSISRWIDLPNFVDYYIAETFYGNIDWPMANSKYWRPVQPDGKWRWVLFDCDLAFDLHQKRCPGHQNSIRYVLGENNCHLPHLDHALLESTTLFRNLMENERFQQRFVSRYLDLLNTNFEAETVRKTIQQLHDQLAPEMPRHISRWSSQKGIRSLARWEKEVAELDRFAQQRPDSMRHFLSEAFKLGKPVAMRFQLSDPEGGTIQINSITPKQLPYEAVFLEKVSIHARAIPAAGYVFKGWRREGEKRLYTELPTEQGTYTALFERKGK